MKSTLRPRLLPCLWLVGLLLLSQALGLVHRIEHADPPHQGEAQAALLPDHEAGGAECRLIDQLGLGDGLCSPLPALVLPPVRPLWRAPAAAAAVARLAPAAYQARAPPV